MGWLVLPVERYGKHPLISWKTGSSNDPEVIKAWANLYPHCNFALHTGRSGIVVLDEDNKTDERLGACSLAWLSTQKDVNFTEDTLRVATPNGGYHYYYSGRCRQTSRLAFEGKALEGLETKSGDGYVLLPGSVLDKGGSQVAYRVVCDMPLAPVPAILITLTGGPPDAPGTKAQAPEDVALDSPATIAWARQFLAGDAPVAPDGERNNRLYEMACRLRDVGLSQDTAARLLVEVYNPLKVLPPAPEADVHQITGNAYRYAQNELGAHNCDWSAPVDWSHPLLADTPGEDLEDDGLVDLTDFIGVDPPAREWLIEDWLPAREVTSLYGDGGSGKSLLSIQLAVAMATGRPFLGQAITQKVKVLGVYCEDKTDELHRRCSAVLNCPEYVMSRDIIANGTVRLWSRAGKQAGLAHIDKSGEVHPTPFYRKLEAELMDMGPEPKLLILDTLTDIFIGSEIDRETVNRFIKVVIGGLVGRHNATVLLLAHPSRQGQQSRDMLSGSTAWNNAVRNRLVLSRLTDGERLALTRVKSNYARVGDRIAVQWLRGAFLPVNFDWEIEENRVALTRRGEAAVARIVTVLRDMGGTCSSRKALAAALAEKFDTPDRTARDWLIKALTTGRVVEREMGITLAVGVGDAT